MDAKNTAIIATDENKVKKKRHCCLFAAVFIVLFFMSTVVFGAYLVSKEKSSEQAVVNQVADSPTQNQDGNSQSDTVKKSTTASTTTTTPSTATNDANKQEQAKLLDFFIELANKDDTDKSWPGSIARWNKSTVSVGVGEGTFSERQSSCLNLYISDFNSASSNVKLIRDDTVDLGIPNIKIFYQDVASFTARSGGNQQYGYEEGLFNDDFSFKRAMVFLSEAIAGLDPTLECQIIRHEVTHGIGFWGHSDIYPESIMSLPKTSYSFNSADKKAIEMLYNSGVSLGAKEAEVRTYFSNKDY